MSNLLESFDILCQVDEVDQSDWFQLRIIPECLDCSLPFSAQSLVCEKCLYVTFKKNLAELSTSRKRQIPINNQNQNNVQQPLVEMSTAPAGDRSTSSFSECVLVTPHSSPIFGTSLMFSNGKN